MVFKMLLLSLVLCCVLSSTSANSVHSRSKRGVGTCNLAGVCGQNERGTIPCAVDRAPTKFDGSPDSVAVLKDECPELFDGVTDPDLCCSEEDVLKMQDIMKMISTQFADCPDCVQNSKEFICHFHCAANQVEFLEIVKQTNQTVDEINYYINEPSLTQLYSSCEKLPAMQAFLQMTGCKPGETCGIQDFVKAMGLTAPFKINAFLSKDDEKIVVNGNPGNAVKFLIKQGGQCASS